MAADSAVWVVALARRKRRTDLYTAATRGLKLSEGRHAAVTQTAPPTTCPGCGLALPPSEGPTHRYLGATAACWALYGEVLAREYGDLGYPPHHRLTVDVYAVQHPGIPERRAIQSVGVHLCRLCVVLERGRPPETGQRLMQWLGDQQPAWRWLDPPDPNGTITVRDVLATRDPAAHDQMVWAWARDVWQAWSPHHPTVRAWIDEAGR